MGNLKIKFFFIVSVFALLASQSCEQIMDESPMEIESVSMKLIMRSSLEFIAHDLRSNGKTLYDLDAVQKSYVSYIKKTYSGAIEYEALSSLSEFNSTGFEANTENEESASPEIQNLLERIGKINDNSESLESYLRDLDGLKDDFSKEMTSEVVKNRGLLEIELNAVLGEFYFENSDLFNKLEGTTMNGGIELYAGSNTVEGWWSRAKAYLKCAAGTIGGGLTGMVVGCGGIGLAIGGPHGAVVGCAIGVVVGGVGGALTGAVASGCFEL
jgi:hypothetical protein